MCKGVLLGVGWGVLTFVFICKHGTLLVCHVQMYHAIAVSCLIVQGFLILIGFNVFLLAMCLKNSSVFFRPSGGLCINQDVS